MVLKWSQKLVGCATNIQDRKDFLIPKLHERKYRFLISITIVFILAILIIMTVIYDNTNQKIQSGNTLLGEH